MTHRYSRTLLAVAAVTMVAALAACDRPTSEPAPAPTTEPTLGQRIDNGTEQVAQATEEVRKDIAQAGEAVADNARDAAITTQVNAELAKDDRLKALQIDVDTVEGRVSLEGTAPDAASRERATALATAVDGVVAVDNRLTVEPRS